MNDPHSRYMTAGGIDIARYAMALPYEGAIEPLIELLDRRLGVVLASNFDYPGRYTRWDIGFSNPMLALEATGRSVVIRALNPRGRVVMPAIIGWLQDTDEITSIVSDDADHCYAEVHQSTQWFPEELRSKQPSTFSVLRSLLRGFHYADETHLGFYGAFGYELAFQFESLRLKIQRQHQHQHQRDMVLFMPDQLLVVDHQKQQAIQFNYEFSYNGKSSANIERLGKETPYTKPPSNAVEHCDHAPGEYADTVRIAIEAFRRGDLFEVVPGQKFSIPGMATPAQVFKRLRKRNPAPYAALMNLGESEYLVAASPEMYVRAQGRRIETCPISGTIKRGENALADAAQIRALLNSAKDESELTMCTDVDRNDKYRICEADSIRVIGRRQIETYSRLFHTVDHVEGLLREGFDALDGFLTHAWAVTVTGAPKQHAMQFIEDHEKSLRRWYGGAIGHIGFNGNINTGLTLRTVQFIKGMAEIRAGATLLFESNPEEEEAETRLKASALIDAVRCDQRTENQPAATHLSHEGKGKQVMIVDHQDSFVHALAGYFRCTGADVTIWRDGFPLDWLAEQRLELLVLSPGPGRPQDFNIHETIGAAIKHNIPIFGVCLGLQGIVEYFNGQLKQAPPVHGKSTTVYACGGNLLEGVPRSFCAARYHSLVADRDTLPKCLDITAETDDGIIMAVEHRHLPIAAVQFHPESIMTQTNGQGMMVVRNAVTRLARPSTAQPAKARKSAGAPRSGTMK